MSSRSSDPFRDRLKSLSALGPRQETRDAQSCYFLLPRHQTPGSDLSPTDGRTTSLMSSTSSARLGSSPSTSRLVLCPWTWTLSLILQTQEHTQRQDGAASPRTFQQEAQTGLPPVPRSWWRQKQRPAGVLPRTGTGAGTG